MKYIKLTFEYMGNKHYWKLMLLSLIPSVLLSLLSSYSTTASFFVKYAERDLQNFKEVFSVFSELSSNTLMRLGLYLLLAILLAVFFAYVIGVVFKHMRTGRFMLRHPAKRVNENFLSAFSAVLGIYLVVFLFGVFMSIAVYFWFFATKNRIATLILAIFSMLLLFVLLLFIISLMSLTVPYMAGEGKGLFSAISASIRTSRAKLKSIALSTLLPLIVMGIIEIGFSFVFPLIPNEIAEKAVDTIVGTIISTFLFSYFPVLFFTIFYDLKGWEREDKKPVNSF